MLTSIGALICVAGVVIAVWGDKQIPVRGGIVLKLFSAPPRHLKWYKYLLGAGLIYCGVEVLIKAWS